MCSVHLSALLTVIQSKFQSTVNQNFNKVNSQDLYKGICQLLSGWHPYHEVTKLYRLGNHGKLHKEPMFGHRQSFGNNMGIQTTAIHI